MTFPARFRDISALAFVLWWDGLSASGDIRLTLATQYPNPTTSGYSVDDLHRLGISDMLIRFLATLGTPFVLFAVLFDTNDRRDG